MRVELALFKLLMLRANLVKVNDVSHVGRLLAACCYLIINNENNKSIITLTKY